MAPEILMKLKYDSKVDVYSLGVTLYEMLALKRPHDNTSVTDESIA